MKAASMTAFVKKVAVYARVAETNKIVTNFDLIDKHGAGICSPDALQNNKRKFLSN
jgi:hypothetical protein